MKNFNLCAFADEADGTLSGQIAALKDNKIGLLEIRGVDGKNISEITLPEAKEIKKRLDDGGIKVWSLGSPLGKVDIKDPFDSQLELCAHLVELAQVLDAPNIRMFSFYGTNGEPSFESAVLENLNKFVQKAKNSGVTLCHENEKGIYGDTPGRCAAIHKNLPDIKSVFDPANFIQCGVDVVSAWDKLASYVKYVHIKDALADGIVVPAGHGAGNIPYILKEFAVGGGTLTIEPHLHVFDGFSKLEEDNKEIKGKYIYPTSRAAFDAAVQALIDCIKAV